MGDGGGGVGQGTQGGRIEEGWRASRRGGDRERRKEGRGRFAAGEMKINDSDARN